MLKCDRRHCALGVCDLCGLPARGEGRRDIWCKGSTIKSKKQVEGVWRILLERCADVEERLVEYERCVCTLCACMSVVKRDVVFGADEAPMKGKTGRIGCSALLPSLL